MTRLPEETSIGAVPLQAAKASRAGGPGAVPGVADDQGGDHRSDAEQAGQAGAAGLDRGGEPGLGSGELGAEVAQVGDVLGGELVAGQRGRAGRLEAAGRRVAWAGVISSAMPPGTRLASRGVQPACGLVAEPGQVTVPFGP